MSESAGVGFLLSGVTSLGFLNSIITLSLSLIFAVAGFYAMSKSQNRTLSIPLFGVALIMLGLHFALFIIYSLLAPGALRFFILVEIWPITLLGLGVGLLFVKKQNSAL